MTEKNCTSENSSVSMSPTKFYSVIISAKCCSFGCPTKYEVPGSEISTNKIDCHTEQFLDLCRLCPPPVKKRIGLESDEATYTIFSEDVSNSGLNAPFVLVRLL